MDCHFGSAGVIVSVPPPQNEAPGCEMPNEWQKPVGGTPRFRAYPRYGREIIGYC